MRNIIIVTTMFILLMIGCKSEQAPTAQTGTAGQEPSIADASLPKVTFAEIVAIDPTSSNPLMVQYTTESGESGSGTVTFRWYVAGALVDDVAGNVLSPERFRKGDSVEAEVVPTDGTRFGTPYRTPPVTVLNTPPVVSSAVLRPVPAFAGDIITAVGTASDRDNDTVTFEYQWMVNNRTVPVEGDRFDTASLKKMDGVSVMVTPYDGEDRGAPVQSTVVFLSNHNPDIISTPASGVSSGVYTYQVVAKDPDGDPVTFSLVSAPEGMTIDQRSGLIRWEPPSDVSGRVDMTVKIAADDGDGGVSYQQFSLGLEMR